MSSLMPQVEYPFTGGAMFEGLIPPPQSQEASLEVGIQASDETVDGRLEFTLVLLGLVRSGRGLLSFPGSEGSREVSVTLSEPGEQRLLYKAKLYQKLKYIERVFDVKFSLSAEISSEEVKRIEIVFRGITEGAFSTREPVTTFLISPKSIDLSEPPFCGVGSFDAAIGEEVELFDQLLNVGPMRVHIERAELANPRIIDEIRKAAEKPVAARFEILDHQVSFYFENYANKSQEDLFETLEQFKKELARDLPEELVSLVSEPLAKDVSCYEASQIAAGWVQYHDLPDRYCPQEPEHVVAQLWRVPIYLVYSNGEGGPVGEVIIDGKTGVIVSHTPIDELRSKGRALAEQILHA